MHTQLPPIYHKKGQLLHKSEADTFLSHFLFPPFLAIFLPKSANPAQMAKHLPSWHILHYHVKVGVVLWANNFLFAFRQKWFCLTLKWYSSETRKGKEMACRMRFSFRVCSTCFSFTTWNKNENVKKHFLRGAWWFLLAFCLSSIFIA